MVRGMMSALALLFGFAFASPAMAQCCGEQAKGCCEKASEEGCCDKDCKDGECPEGCCPADMGALYAVKFNKIDCGTCRDLVSAEIQKIEGVAAVKFCEKTKAMIVVLKKDATAPSKESIEKAVVAANAEFKLESFEKFEMPKTADATKKA